MSYDFVIIGGGCYGSYYVHQLIEARERAKIDWQRIAVLDRDPECRVAAMGNDDVDVVETEWTEFGRRAFAEPERWMAGQLVPAPIAPHVVRHWLLHTLESDGVLATDATWPGAPPADMPFSMVTDAGGLVLSWAPGLCPTNCVEPRKCPLTGTDRSWDMPVTVDAAAQTAGLDHVETFVCRHYAYGVGTIDFQTVRDARSRLAEVERPALVGIATVSGCHGLVDVVRLTSRS